MLISKYSRVRFGCLMNIRRDGEHHQPCAECVSHFPTSLMPGVMVGAAMNTTYGANSAVRRTFKA